MGFKLVFSWLMLWKVNAENWAGTPFPIIHGNYQTDYFGNGKIYDFEFWSITDSVLTGMDIYTNGDFFVR